jgi:hypothetical protein
VIALIALDYNFEKLECGEPDKKIYWSALVDNLESIQKDKNDMIIHEFIKFTRENNMSYEKVKWPLLDGLKEKDNFLKMLNGVLGKCTIKDQSFSRPKGYKDSHTRDYNNLSYAYKDMTVGIAFFHSLGIMYFLIFDPEEKIKENRFSIWNEHVVVGEFDLNKEPFFNLDKTQQENKLNEFIESCIIKLEDKHCRRFQQVN